MCAAYGGGWPRSIAKMSGADSRKVNTTPAPSNPGEAQGLCDARSVCAHGHRAIFAQHARILAAVHSSCGGEVPPESAGSGDSAPQVGFICLPTSAFISKSFLQKVDSMKSL